MTPATQIDVNADVGEGFGRWQLGDDDEVLRHVSSANIACGFHAGDPLIMRTTVARALDSGIGIGAHIGFRDLAGFGRRPVSVSADELYAETLYQIGALDAIARAQGGSVQYVKAHGALYNRIMTDSEHALAVIEAVRDYPATLALVGLAKTPFHHSVQSAGIRYVREAFIDRAIGDDGTLISRSLPGSLILDHDEVARRAVCIAQGRAIPTFTGGERIIEADTLCIHGDNPHAGSLAKKVRTELEHVGVRLAPFVP